MVAERNNSKISMVLPRKGVFLTYTTRPTGSAWSSHHSHSEHLTDGCSVLTSVSTITKTVKRGNWDRQTAIKYFCPEVTHVCFAHICLAKASPLATHGLNVAERCSLLPGELKHLWVKQWSRTRMSTAEEFTLDGEHRWYSVYKEWIIKATRNQASTIW